MKHSKPYLGNKLSYAHSIKILYVLISRKLFTNNNKYRKKKHNLQKLVALTNRVIFEQPFIGIISCL